MYIQIFWYFKSTLVIFVFSRNLSMSSKCPIWHKVIQNNPFNSFFSRRIDSSNYIPFFIPDFGNLCLLCFFFVNLDKCLAILLVFLKNQLLVSLIFKIVFYFLFHWFPLIALLLCFTCFGFNLPFLFVCFAKVTA